MGEGLGVGVEVDEHARLSVALVNGYGNGLTEKWFAGDKVVIPSEARNLGRGPLLYSGWSALPRADDRFVSRRFFAQDRLATTAVVRGRSE